MYTALGVILRKYALLHIRDKCVSIGVHFTHPTRKPKGEKNGKTTQRVCCKNRSARVWQTAVVLHRSVNNRPRRACNRDHFDRIGA